MRAQHEEVGVGKMGFLRVAVLVTAVSGAMAAAAGPVSAAGGTVHTRSSSLTVSAHLVGESGGASTWADVNVALTDAATNTASLVYEQWVDVTQPDGSVFSMLTASGSGTVHLSVAGRLSSATVTGSISVVQCAEFGCSPTAVVVPVQGTWTATSDPIRTRTRTIVSGSKTSRQSVAESASYRYADATVLVDGVSLGVVDFPTDATIADAHSSSVDFYFAATAANLPGTLASGSVTPYATADPRQRFTSFFQSADAAWSISDAQMTREAYFYASYDRTESRGTLVKGVSAWYYDFVYMPDAFGNMEFVQSTSGSTESGSFDVGPRLATASYAGSMPLQTCTVISPGEEICGDAQNVSFDFAWTSTGPTTRTIYNQGYTGWDGGYHTSHAVWETVPAAATGSMAGSSIGAATSGKLQQIHDTHDGSAV